MFSHIYAYICDPLFFLQVFRPKFCMQLSSLPFVIKNSRRTLFPSFCYAFPFRRAKSVLPLTCVLSLKWEAAFYTQAHIKQVKLQVRYQVLTAGSNKATVFSYVPLTDVSEVLLVLKKVRFLCSVQKCFVKYLQFLFVCSLFSV
jgi:hypothetical protein